jgi:hypothetical protein
VLCWTVQIQLNIFSVKARSDMKTLRATLFFGAIGCALWSPNLLGQDVQVTSDKGVTTLSVKAQKAYVAGQSKTPMLSVVCQQKGKKIVHAIVFAPEGFVTEQEVSSFGNSTSLDLEMTIGEHKQATNWVHQNFQSFKSINYGSYDYVGKTEPERIQLLQSLLSVPTVSIAFTPFLTGIPASSTFDLTGLRTEFDKHPECAMN